VLGETSSSSRWRVAGDGAAGGALFGFRMRGDFADVGDFAGFVVVMVAHVSLARWLLANDHLHV
jgi:hypothetical protein